MKHATRHLLLLGGVLLAAACGGNTGTGPDSPLTPGDTAGAGGPVTGPGTGGSGFVIDLRWVGPVPGVAVQSAFANAKARWERIITGDLADEVLTTGANSIPANACVAGQPALSNTTIDDLIIYVRVDSIDGRGKVLGQASPCYIRSGTTLALVGTMKFDEADMATMVGNGTIDEVILHEMAHVIGLGTLWDGNLSRTQTSESDTSWIRATDVRYKGASGNDAWLLLGGLGGAPIENCATGVSSTCGSGTWLGHWRESTFRNELMTGYISATGNPISALTVGALADLGYRVSGDVADAYALPSGISFSGVVASAVKLEEEVGRGPLYSIGGGRTRRLR